MGDKIVDELVRSWEQNNTIELCRSWRILSCVTYEFIYPLFTLFWKRSRLHEFFSLHLEMIEVPLSPLTYFSIFHTAFRALDIGAHPLTQIRGKGPKYRLGIRSLFLDIIQRPFFGISATSLMQGGVDDLATALNPLWVTKNQFSFQFSSFRLWGSLSKWS